MLQEEEAKVDGAGLGTDPSIPGAVSYWSHGCQVRSIILLQKLNGSNPERLMNNLFDAM